MSEGKSSKPLKDLESRLRDARAARRPSTPNATPEGGVEGIGAALRIGSELVAALIVGVGIGLLLDNWLETTPWFMVVFFFIGAGAGVLNVYRQACGFGLAPGYRKTDNGNSTGSGDSKAGENKKQGPS